MFRSWCRQLTRRCRGSRIRTSRRASAVGRRKNRLRDGRQAILATEGAARQRPAGLDEATEILEARRGRVRQLHLLSVNADVTAARERQREFVNVALGESQKIAPLLRELAVIRRKIIEIDEQEYLYIRSINAQLGLQGCDQIGERLRFNIGGIFPPNFVDVEVFEEFASRNRKNLADF